MAQADGGAMAEQSLARSQPVSAQPLPALRDESYWTRPLRRFRRHTLAMLGVIVLTVLVLSAGLAPWVAPYSPTAQDLSNRLKPPSLAHPMGTDDLGRDQLTRILYGGRISLLIGVLAMTVAVTLGTLVGALAGFFGGRTDNVLMRFTDVMISFPTLFLLILLASLFGTSFITIVLVIGFLSWMGVARLVRASFLSLKEQQYVEAAHCIGVSPARMIMRHLLPNALGPIIVAATIGVAGAILTESALSYLGFGIQPPTPTWGNMLRYAQDQMSTAPWTAIFPGLMIFLAALAINYIGDGLRDALDPRQDRLH